MASSSENSNQQHHHRIAIPATVALTTLDNTSGAVVVAEIQISASNVAAAAAAASAANAANAIQAASKTTSPPGTTTVQAVAQQIRLSPLQSQTTNSTGTSGRDITSSGGSGVMTGNNGKYLLKKFDNFFVNQF